MTPREREIRERLEKATPLRTDSEMNFYIPMTGYGGITLIDQKRYDAPMTRVDIEFYNSSFGDIRYLLAQLTQAREIIERAKWTLSEVQKHCLCERSTKGFDYHEKHTKLGKPEVGTRWLTPEVLCKDALAKITEMEKEK